MMEPELITTKSPAYDDEEASVLVPEASSKEIAIPAASVRKALPQTPAPAPVLLVLPSDTLPQPVPSVPAIVQPIHEFSSTIPAILEQVHKPVAPVRTIAHPIPQEVTQVSIAHVTVAHVTVAHVTVAPFLLLGGRWRGHCGEQGR